MGVRDADDYVPDSVITGGTRPVLGRLGNLFVSHQEDDGRLHYLWGE